MAMNAEPSDAPDWLIQKPRKCRPTGLMIALALGCLATYTALELTGRTLPKRMAMETDVSSVTPVAAVGNHLARPLESSSGKVSRTSVGLSVETIPIAASQDPTPSVASTMQTVFNDQNFIPRGASNVVTFSKTPASVVSREPLPQETKISIVGRSSNMKDRVCWPYKGGSLELRNCRAAVGLKYRN